MVSEPITFKPELTFKQNVTLGRHGWLRLTPAYSVGLVNQILKEYETKVFVLDPYSGTATTTLAAAYLGHRAISFDINPFLIWLGKAKVDLYDVAVISRAESLFDKIEQLYSKSHESEKFIPNIANIDRWWNNHELDFLGRTRFLIDSLSQKDSQERSLLDVAFCRTLIKLSNAAFNHQSVSFKSVDNQKQPVLFETVVDYLKVYFENLKFVTQSCYENPMVRAEVNYGDSRDLTSCLDDEVDVVITSPPYPNRMSYIRELRPYMYWLNFLSDGKEAGELDWKAIGGTWGVATSKLNDWVPQKESFDTKSLDDVIKKISHVDNKNGYLMAQYLKKYFFDMWHHFESMFKVLKRGGEFHYIVGNSSFYGELVHVEEIYKEMLLACGCSKVEIVKLRKRSSKKELFEFVVRGKK